MAEPVILGETAKQAKPEELVTVYVTNPEPGTYAFALEGDESAARTVTAQQLQGWQIVQRWLQGELATAYRDYGF